MASCGCNKGTKAVSPRYTIANGAGSKSPRSWNTGANFEADFAQWKANGRPGLSSNARKGTYVYTNDTGRDPRHAYILQHSAKLGPGRVYDISTVRLIPDNMGGYKVVGGRQLSTRGTVPVGYRSLPGRPEIVVQEELYSDYVPMFRF